MWVKQRKVVFKSGQRFSFGVRWFIDMNNVDSWNDATAENRNLPSIFLLFLTELDILGSFLYYWLKRAILCYFFFKYFSYSTTGILKSNCCIPKTKNCWFTEIYRRYLSWNKNISFVPIESYYTYDSRHIKEEPWNSTPTYGLVSSYNNVQILNTLNT